ncbi:MAG TPA: hypothetical protein VIO64_19385 [Pseudobacteroides sp.]|uniref:hypothetical protein n=1 Tax=Pseudobacteroides sp. TaxID=1968840 RepID=UPI002F932FE8
MFQMKDVDAFILNLISNEAKISSLDFEDTVELSSIQILRVLAQIEKKFQVEIDDKYVFHGLFSSARVLSSYISNKLSLTDSKEWMESIKK